MSKPREVVVTGLGVVTPIGVGRAPMVESFRAGRSGVKPLVELQGTPFPVWYGGAITDFDPKLFVTPRKSLKLMCREIQTAFAASVLAIQDAQLQTASLDHDRFGVTFGSEMLYSSPEEMVEVYHNCTVDGQFDITRWGQRMTSDLFPLWMLKHLPNMPACHIAIAQDARGPNNTFTLGEVSGLHALQEATRYIQRDWADIMLTGGTGSRLNISALLFRGHELLSHWQGDPAGASRPFDARRDGSVNGEGAGAVLIETLEHATRRGATPLARIAGIGNSFEKTPPPGQGRTGQAVRRSIVQALREAQIAPGEIAFVTASAQGHRWEDPAEAQAIRAELGDVPVWAPKSYFGNLGAGTASVELAAAVDCLIRGEIPATLNYEVADPDCPVEVANSPRACSPGKPVLVLGQSLTGQATAVVLAPV